MRRNLAELPRLAELAADWGVDRLWVQNLSHTFDDTDPHGSYRGIRQFAAEEALWTREDLADARRAFSATRAAARARGLPVRLPRLRPPPSRARADGEPGCGWPWESAYVTHDGVVQPCCMVMGSDRANLGSLAERPFAEIWSAERYREFREALLTRDAPPAVCRGCAAYRGVF